MARSMSVVVTQAIRNRLPANSAHLLSCRKCRSSSLRSSARGYPHNGPIKLAEYADAATGVLFCLEKVLREKSTFRNHRDEAFTSRGSRANHDSRNQDRSNLRINWMSSVTNTGRVM